MAGSYYNNQQGLSWREIILDHIQKILECSRCEFRGGFNREVGNNPSTIIYVEDTRQTYINAIKSLSDVLIPFFDSTMTTKSGELDKTSEEVKDEIKGETRKQINKEYKESKAKYKKDQKKYPKPDHQEYLEDWRSCGGLKFDDLKHSVVITQLENARKLFQQLNLLLKRKDFLKGAIYSEEDLEEDGEGEAVEVDE